MNEKKHTYNSSVLALPPLKLVLGDVPSPDGEGRSPFPPFGAGKELEAKNALQKLIGHIEEPK